MFKGGRGHRDASHLLAHPAHPRLPSAPAIDHVQLFNIHYVHLFLVYGRRAAGEERAFSHGSAARLPSRSPPLPVSARRRPKALLCVGTSLIVLPEQFSAHLIQFHYRIKMHMFRHVTRIPAFRPARMCVYSLAHIHTHTHSYTSLYVRSLHFLSAIFAAWLYN